MLDLEPENLLAEIEASMAITKMATDTQAMLIRDFHGSHYLAGIIPDNPVPENHALEYISLITPKIVHANPTTLVSSRYSGVDRKKTKGLQHAINRWAQDVELWRTFLRVWYDVAFGFGVTLTSMEPVPGYVGYAGAKPLRPVVKRIAPSHFFIDSQCEDITEARLVGHMWRKDKQDLLDDPRYNSEAVEQLVADAQTSSFKPFHDQKQGIDQTNRDEIVGYDVWIPEVQSGDPSRGENGTIYTVGCGVKSDNTTTKGRWLRDPRPHYGHPRGPYNLWGVYIVPGYPLPLSPLAATEDQVKELNEHARQAAEDARQHKRFVAFDPQNRAAGRAAKDARHGDVVAIPGLGDGAVREISIGGVDARHLEYLEYIRERMERVTGVSETSRGSVTGDGTATEHSIASQGQSDRIAMIQNMFEDCARRVLYSAAWYLWSSEFSIVRLGEEAVDDLDPRPVDLPSEAEASQVARRYGIPTNAAREALHWSPELVFEGGNPIEEFEDMQLMIEPYSMQRVSDSLLQARSRDVLKIMVESSGVMVSSPHINWSELFDQIGEPLNIKNLGEIIRTPILHQMWQSQGIDVNNPQQQGVPQPQGPGSAGAAPSSPMAGHQQGGVLAAAQSAA